MKKITWGQLPKLIDQKAKMVVQKRTHALRAEIVAVWPVKSGRSKAGWKIRGNQHGYSIVNNVKSPEGYDYVPNLWIGLPVGSAQLPNGGDPIYQRHARLLMKDFKRMKL